jgi:hypothetical protein
VDRAKREVTYIRDAEIATVLRPLYATPQNMVERVKAADEVAWSARIKETAIVVRQ